jgi:hypothetical protein
VHKSSTKDINPMPRAARLTLHFLVDLWHCSASGSELSIDLRRVNAELRRAALVGLEDDVVYRERVKQRMREGTACTHPPLIDRNKLLKFRRTAVTADVA